MLLTDISVMEMVQLYLINSSSLGNASQSLLIQGRNCIFWSKHYHVITGFLLKENEEDRREGNKEEQTDG